MGAYSSAEMFELVCVSSSDAGLELRLSGRLDSTNARQVEDALVASGAGQAQSGLTLDIDKLTYLSSSGLRVLLRLQRALPKKVILHDAQPSVFEVCAISGLSELMHVVRQPREMCLAGCPVVGRGAYGVVYQLDDDTIVKMCPPGYPLSALVRERELTRYALVRGIPTALPLDVVRAGDALGLSFKMIRAQSMQSLLVSRPERLEGRLDGFVPLFATSIACTTPRSSFPPPRRRSSQTLRPASAGMGGR